MLRHEERLTGLKAIASMGMPHEFAAQTMLVANTFGISIAIRAGLPYQLYEFPSAPKPPTVKWKTGNWGLTAGVIAYDPIIGKHNADGSLANAGRELPSVVEPLQHEITLEQIIEGLQGDSPTLSLISDDPTLSAEEYTRTTGILLLKPNGKENTAAKDVVFKIHLHTTSPSTTQPAKSFIKTEDKPAIYSQPTWWNHAFGDFNEQSRLRFLLSYRKAPKSDFEPVNIFGLKIKRKLLPITGDMDLLWITRRMGNNAMFDDTFDGSEAHTEFNTFIAEQIEPFAKILKKLDEQDAEEPLSRKHLKTKKLARLGCITPFEAYIMILINQRFEKLVKHFVDLFQHGAENRSPIDPSDLNDRILHIHKGQFTMTNNEKDLVDFVFGTPGYIRENFITIHPKWNMALWGPVIEKQLFIGQPVKPETKEAYLNYLKEHDITKYAQLTAPSILGPSLFRRSSSISNSENSPAILRRRNSSFTDYSREGSPRTFRRKDSDESILQKRRNSSSRRNSLNLFKVKGPLLTVFLDKTEGWNPLSSFCEAHNTNKLRMLTHEASNINATWIHEQTGEITILFADERTKRVTQAVSVYFASDTFQVIAEKMDDQLRDAVLKIINTICPNKKLTFNGRTDAIKSILSAFPENYFDDMASVADSTSDESHSHYITNGRRILEATISESVSSEKSRSSSSRRHRRHQAQPYITDKKTSSKNHSAHRSTSRHSDESSASRSRRKALN